jgi:hypothetical protein
LPASVSSVFLPAYEGAFVIVATLYSIIAICGPLHDAAR